MTSALMTMPTAYFYYLMAGCMIPAGYFSGAPTLYAIVFITLITNPIMSKTLSPFGYFWYGYFALVDFAVGAYLLSFNSDFIRIAAALSILSGIVTLSCSRWPNWIHHNYDQITAVINTAFLACLIAAAWFDSPLGLR